MSKLETKVIRESLKQVKSKEDAEELAVLIMKLTDSVVNKAGDAFWQHGFRDLLTGLIEVEAKAEQPSYWSIIMKSKEPVDELRKIKELRQFFFQLTDNQVQLILPEVQARLGMIGAIERHEQKQTASS